MQTSLRARFTKALTVGAAVALSVSLGGVAANAADPDIGNINTTKNGSITIYKHINQASSPAVVGTPADTSDALASASKPVAGVKFAAFMAQSLPLTGNGANANWAKIAGVTNDQLASACSGVTDTAGSPTLSGFTFGARMDFPETNAQGMAKKANLAQGAYLLCEVKAPSTVVGTAAPILVTIPHPDRPAGKWHYDVTIYPKNSVAGINKTVKSQPIGDLGLNKPISWPVTADIPQLASGEHLTYFIVKDPMTDSRIASKGVASVKIGNQPLTNGTDFTVTTDPEFVSIGLTKAGLQRAEVAGGQKLTVVFTSTLNAVGNGKLDNTAQLLVGKWNKPTPENPTDNPKNPPKHPGEPPFPTNPPTTPPVTSNWGNVKLHKVNQGNPNEGLAGAKFQVFAATTQTAYSDDCTNAVATGDALQVGPGNKTEFVSNAQGVVEIPGLFVSDSVNNPVNKTHRCYVVKELEAPAGYVLPSNPNTGVKVNIGTTTTGQYNATITNAKSVVPQLPLTGAMAQLLLPIIGGILVVGGLVVGFAYRRRKNQA